jgi:hypothetical protein
VYILYNLICQKDILYAICIFFLFLSKEKKKKTKKAIFLIKQVFPNLMSAMVTSGICEEQWGFGNGNGHHYSEEGDQFWKHFLM